MEALSRIRLYSDMLNSVEYGNEESSQRVALVVNIDILTGIEEHFLAADNMEKVDQKSEPIINEILDQNIVRVREAHKDKETLKLLRQLEKLSQEYTNKDWNSRTVANRSIFNKIINELSSYNSHFIEEGVMPVSAGERGGRKQVFLSHAYDDRLYTLALFEHFYNLEIYLYIDWMHHKKMEDGRILKQDLKRELDNSDQLLFLRTINSELDIQGKQMLRPWCAWELGNFYRKEGKQKYMLSLYSVGGYNKDHNIQLHGLKLYEGVHNGLLTGTEITP